MYIVKISAPFNEWLRQTPSEKGIWKNAHFFVNDDSIKECDYWVVYEGLVKEETVFCPKENVILITGEPPSIKKYNKKFLRQFSKIITCHRNIEHDNIIYWQQALPWHIGRRQIDNQNIKFAKNYDYLRKITLKATDKNKIFSVILSNKAFTQGHRDRIDFVKMLKNHFGDKIDIFGRGFKEVEDKWNAIAPYKYHIVLENSSLNDYWTEKLADAFLGESYPIYYGANNIYSYFSKNSLTKIDIHKPEEAIKIIEMVMEGNYQEKYKNEIIKSKNKILDEYNLFPTIISKIIVKDENQNYEKNKVVLKPEVLSKKLFIKRLLKRILPTYLINFMKNNQKRLDFKLKNL